MVEHLAASGRATPVCPPDGPTAAPHLRSEHVDEDLVVRGELTGLLLHSPRSPNLAAVRGLSPDVAATVDPNLWRGSRVRPERRRSLGRRRRPPRRRGRRRSSSRACVLSEAVTALDGACKGADAAAFEPAFHRVHESFHAVMEAAHAPPHPAAKA